MLNACLAVLPILVFLGALVLLDSFKLVKPRMVAAVIAAGAAAAVVGAPLHGWLLDRGAVGPAALSRWVAPVTEELLKGIPVVFLLARKRAGFLVDAAILGFAVGAGFAVVENVEYLRAGEEGGVFLWIVRGFGTAFLHGGTASILAVASKGLLDRGTASGPAAYLPGLAAAIAIHSLFNHFVFPPILMTLAIFVTFPVAFLAIFGHSERGTREWLRAGFDSDVEMLETMLGGELGDSRVGRYLLSLQSHFEGPVVADMLCLLRVRLELSIRAKGILLAREAGLPIELGDDAVANLQELRALEHSIGPTGRLALQPVLGTTDRDVWQIQMLETERASGRRRPSGA